jgi:hypothetical protein
MEYIMCQHAVVKENYTERSMWYNCVECGKCIDSVVVGALKRLGKIEIETKKEEEK